MPHLKILITTFIQGIYNYIPETNHIYSVYSFAAFNFCCMSCYFAHGICFVFLQYYFLCGIFTFVAEFA
jgi:hypothetical protein